MSEIKNSPIEDFDWEAYAKGETFGDKSQEELVKTYDESLNTIKDKEMVELAEFFGVKYRKDMLN